MIAVRTNDDNEVVEIRYSAPSLRDGEVEVAEIPQEPMVGEHERAVLVLTGDRIAYRIDQLPTPEPEPTEPPAPTHAEIEAARAEAYRETVDPITCEIARLRDMGGTAEEIAEAEARREAAVTAVKAQWPYPEGAE